MFTERSALLHVKSLLFDPSNRLNSWQGDDCCIWEGVRCSSSGHVVSLDLRNPSPQSFLVNLNSELVPASSNVNKSTAIQGKISPSLFTLKQLHYLHLSFNDFMSSTLPSGLSNLTSLTYLNLSNAMFDDSITTQLANLTSLTQLDLSCSTEIIDVSCSSVNLTSSYRFTLGSLYSYFANGNLYSLNLNWLQGLTNLEVLRLTGVDLLESSQSTSWAQPISSLFNLNTLYLSNCRLSGRIHIDQLLNLTHLQFCVVNSNNLSSQIPDQLANLTSLSIIDLRNCNLQGSIPYLPQLKGLYVGYNYGLTIDLGFNRLTLKKDDSSSKLNSNIQELEFASCNIGANNNLQGTIPAQLEDFEVINVSGNNFSGIAPAQNVSFAGNKLNGQIPPSFCKSVNALEVLDLSYNSLSGKIPRSLGNCMFLVFLSLGGNILDGNIPLELQFAKNLGYLDLSGNNFDGPFPDVVRRFQSLEGLKLENNRFEGRIPHFVGKLHNLRLLVLASNLFSGSISQEILQREKLQYLGLSNNSLSGLIPNKLENLKMLRVRPTDGTILGFLISSAFVGAELDIVTKRSSYQLELVYSYHSGVDISQCSDRIDSRRDRPFTGSLHAESLAQSLVREVEGEILQVY
ncbi:hypothetical protein AgCh_004421 [Apium graveolens]